MIGPKIMKKKENNKWKRKKSEQLRSEEQIDERKKN